MTKKVEEILTVQKENLQELITNIPTKTNKVVSSAKRKIKDTTTKVAEFIEDNKTAAKRIGAGIGAAAIVTTSAMGLAGCDELPLFGGEQQREEGETTPTYSYEEYESAFNEIFKEKLEKEAEGEYYLEALSVHYAIYNGEESSRGTFNFTDENNNDLNINIDELNLSKDAYIELRDSIPEDAITTFAKGWGFTVNLSKLNEETKIQLLKLFFDNYAQLYPNDIEDLTLGE